MIVVNEYLLLILIVHACMISYCFPSIRMTVNQDIPLTNPVCVSPSIYGPSAKTRVRNLQYGARNELSKIIISLYLEIKRAKTMFEIFGGPYCRI